MWDSDQPAEWGAPRPAGGWGFPHRQQPSREPSPAWEPPQGPPGWPPPRSRRKRPWTPGRIAATVLAAIAVLVAAFTLPVPLIFAYVPGPVRDVGDLVEVTDARTYTSEGELYLTTVSVDTGVTFVEWMGAIVDPEKSAVLRDQVTGGLSLRELERQQALEMRNSKRHAREVALTALGFPRPRGRGARVIQVVRGSPAAGVIEAGDVIVEVDGTPTPTTCDVGRAIEAHEVGDTVQMTVRRGGNEERASLQTVENPSVPGASFVGIAMTDVGYRYSPGVAVEIRSGEIAGPSAGLMFALALYDRLTPDDLTGGRAVAGTGTIECDGGVGPIGGIEQKVAGAEAAGAEVFFAPVANASAARAVAETMDVVAVSNFEDALGYLQDLD